MRRDDAPTLSRLLRVFHGARPGTDCSPSGRSPDLFDRHRTSSTNERTHFRNANRRRRTTRVGSRLRESSASGETLSDSRLPRARKGDADGQEGAARRGFRKRSERDDDEGRSFGANERVTGNPLRSGLAEGEERLRMHGGEWCGHENKDEVHHCDGRQAITYLSMPLLERPWVGPSSHLMHGRVATKARC